MPDFLTVFLALVGEANLVGDAHSFEVLDELTEIDVPSDEVALRVETAKVLGLVVEVDPEEGDGRTVCLQNESVGVVPNPEYVFGEVDN